MALIKCSECGKEISDKVEVCFRCGCPISITKAKCPKCGAERKPGDTECRNLKCGVIYEKYEAYIAKQRATKAESIETPKIKKTEIPQQEAAGPKTHPATIGCAVAFVLFIFIAINLMHNGGGGDSPSKPKSTQTIVGNSPWDSSVSQVKKYLKRNLKDPGSLDVIEWSPVVKRSDGGYQVRCKYRAKNSLGGYVIENQIFIMDANGNVTSVTNY